VATSLAPAQERWRLLPMRQRQPPGRQALAPRVLHRRHPAPQPLRARWKLRVQLPEPQQRQQSLPEQVQLQLQLQLQQRWAPVSSLPMRSGRPAAMPAAASAAQALSSA